MTYSRIIFSIFLTYSIVAGFNHYVGEWLEREELRIEMEECATDYQVEVLNCMNQDPLKKEEEKNKEDREEREDSTDFYEQVPPKTWEI